MRDHKRSTCNLCGVFLFDSACRYAHFASRKHLHQVFGTGVQCQLCHTQIGYSVENHLRGPNHSRERLTVFMDRGWIDLSSWGHGRPFRTVQNRGQAHNSRRVEREKGRTAFARTRCSAALDPAMSSDTVSRIM